MSHTHFPHISECNSLFGVFDFSTQTTHFSHISHTPFPHISAFHSLFDQMGTQLALQYAGSQALHATNSNAARDFLQSVKRFYRNTSIHQEKQDKKRSRSSH